VTGLCQLGSVLQLATQATGLLATRENVSTGHAGASAATGRAGAVPRRAAVGARPPPVLECWASPECAWIVLTHATPGCPASRADANRLQCGVTKPAQTRVSPFPGRFLRERRLR
jgi:hypothetical protein